MSKYKGWYAMKKRLEAQGKWKGASHRVPAQEEGETAAKQPKLTENQEEAIGEAGGSPSDPEEGTSHNAQGMLTIFILQSTYGGLWIFKRIYVVGMARYRHLEISEYG